MSALVTKELGQQFLADQEELFYFGPWFQVLSRLITRGVKPSAFQAGRVQIALDIINC